MDKVVPAIVVVAVIALLITLMLLGWRRRSRQVQVPAPTRVTGSQDGASFTGLYLATTLASDRLQRVTTHGLGYRERGDAVVTSAGIVILGDVLIPVGDITGIERATWTIDRGVEPNGLNAITWMLGDTELTSFLRLDDPEGFDAATTQYTTGQDNT